MWREPKVKEPKPPRFYRNPIHLAREWGRALETGIYSLPADLARGMKLSRARVTQMLGLLKLDSGAQQLLESLGDPLTSRIVSERNLRPILKSPQEEQRQKVEALLASKRTSLVG